jgi:multiple antibiotic resistance protein
MKDLAYAFTLCLATLGPTKTIPVFYLATRTADWRTVVALALKSTLVATAIVLFVALGTSGTLASWQVSIEAVQIAGGIVLALAAVKTLTSPTFGDAPSGTGGAPSDTKQSTAWLGRPVLAPLAVPGLVPPVGVMVVLFFSTLTVGDAEMQSDFAILLAVIMAMNFAAMLCARLIMRVVGIPVLQVTGWVFSALQAGLGVQAVISALHVLNI